MKKLSVFLLATLALVLTGCLDTIEDITIEKNGNGVYTTSMDLSSMFDMLEIMAAMDTTANSQFKFLADKDIDSVLYMRSFTDTATDLSPEQKRLYQNAKMHLVINQKEKVFKLDMCFPFQKLEDIQAIMELNQDGKSLRMLGKPGNNSQATERMVPEENSMPSPSEVFDMTIKNGLLERKLNAVKYNELKENDQFREMKGSEQMLEGMTFRTVIHLPKAAKKITGERASLSEDKKTVTLSSSLADLIKDPSVFAYRIEY